VAHQTKETSAATPVNDFWTRNPARCALCFAGDLWIMLRDS
jgi:hypothetical protein